MKTETVAARGSGAVRRVLEAELKAARARGAEHPSVVDVGGGSGGWAVPFAAAGCRVTVVEPSPNALATLQRRAGEEGVSDLITVIADDADALGRHVPAGSADLDSVPGPCPATPFGRRICPGCVCDCLSAQYFQSCRPVMRARRSATCAADRRTWTLLAT